MIRLFAFVFVVLVCSGFTAKRSLYNFSLIHASNLHLEMEPCGCSLNARGGMDRQANVMKKWEDSVPTEKFVKLSSGTALVPIVDEYKPDLLDVYRNKADFFMEGLQLLGYQAISPSIEDLALGTETLKKLAAKSTVKFVSANLADKKTKKLLFEPFIIIPAKPLPILVTGLSMAKPNKKYKGAEANTIVLPPKQALQAVLEQEKKAPHFVIVLSSLSQKEAEKIAESLSPIHMILGSNDLDTTLGVEKITRSTLRLNPSHRAMTLARADFQLRVPVLEFFNPTVDGRLRGVPEVASIESPNISRFDYESVDLNSDLSSPNNELTELIARYKKAVEAAATKGEI